MKAIIIIIIILTISEFLVILSCRPKQKDNYDNRYTTSYLDTTKYQIGDTIEPFKYYNFDQNKWRAEIKISQDDAMDLSHRIPNKRKLTSSNSEVLKKLKDWKFLYMGGDIATVLNQFKLFKNDSLLVSFEIILDRNMVGMQSQKYGWMPAIDSSLVFETIGLFEK